MIRVLYMSDLHLEMEGWRLAVPGWPAFLARHRAVARHPARGPMLTELPPVDLVVLAGDIHDGLRGIVYADQVAKFLNAPVVYVAGNHEYYHQNMARLQPAFFKAAAHCAGRVTYLENTSARFEIRGERLTVLGCTLWTDYAVNGDADAGMAMAAAVMNDHIRIQNGAALFTPADARALHLGSRAWLREALAGTQGKCLVVTHHAPSAALLGRRSGEIAPAYASELLAGFAGMAPAAWIHGHTHYRHEGMVDGVRVASAPRGYVVLEEAALGYRPGLLEL